MALVGTPEQAWSSADNAIEGLDYPQGGWALALGGPHFGEGAYGWHQGCQSVQRRAEGGEKDTEACLRDL